MAEDKKTAPTVKERQARPQPPAAPPYTPPPSPEGLFYYQQKGGRPDLKTAARPGDGAGRSR